MPGSIVFAGIVPHPPLLIPEVGGARIKEVADSKRALERFANRLLASDPDTIVIISPHSPLDPQVFTTRSTGQLEGDFREFHAPAVRLAFQNDAQLIEAIKQAATADNIELRLLKGDVPLDHGALVPLYYLHEAGWRGPAVVIGFTLESNQKHMSFGRAIARGAYAIGRNVAVVASGDLSHRLIVDGPYAFEPTAHLFDEQIVAAISHGDARSVIDIDQDLRNRAGECGYRSIVIALGALEENLRDHEVLSYEGPFGVGYLVAVLFDQMKTSV